MAITDIPTSFGLSFFVRSFLPGFIASILYTCALMPIVSKNWNPLDTSNLPISIIIGLILGLMISSLDFQIYQLFEGLRFWPVAIKKWEKERTKENFQKIDTSLKFNYDKIDEIEKKDYQTRDDKIELQIRWEEISKLSAKAREFPYDPDETYFCRRRPEIPTRFGNVIAEYEQYSEKQYGMHMMVFWQHLWFILPKELRDDLDLRGANVDSLVYLSFIFLSYSLIGGVGYYFQSNTWISFLVYDIPIGSVICIIVSLTLSHSFYEISITAHKSYGRYIKAIFDLFRGDLAGRLNAQMEITNLIPDKKEKEQWEKYRDFLLDYRKI